ncbi:MAG TPA: peptide deformylase [Desulfomicrobiaceae bacterium]|nr:peptide deformylase [Desulfomicrobiaceae bacterium]HCF06135.1 peptide deformylase [Desulfomicrobiaceae bacterium]
MARTIRTYPDPVLAQKATPIAEVTEEIRQLAHEMLELMYQNDGIGLAAPQVGESVRLVTMDLSGPKERTAPRVFVNPVLSGHAGEVDSEEGCLSVIGYRTTVPRAERVHLSATDLDGNPIEEDADGLFAICLQHEIDHLDGILFIDRISRLKRTLYEKRLQKWLKQKERTPSE